MRKNHEFQMQNKNARANEVILKLCERLAFDKYLPLSLRCHIEFMA